MIPSVRIIRIETSKEYGTLGVLKINDKLFCCTLEESDQENKNSISNIPTGQYLCKRYSSEKYKNTFEVTGVTDRDKILFHAGNTISDTEGCILLGLYFDKLSSFERAVINSGVTFKRFINIMADISEFNLTIIENY